MKTLLTLFLTALCGVLLAGEEPAKPKHDGPAGKPYIYVKNISLHIAKGQQHSFFNKEPWRTVTLIEADKFLVKQGLLTGEPSLKMPASGESLVLPP